MRDTIIHRSDLQDQTQKNVVTNEDYQPKKLFPISRHS